MSKLTLAKTSAFVILILVLLMAGVGYLIAKDKGWLSIQKPSNQTTQMIPLQLPLSVLVVNKYNGSAITNVNVDVIKDGRPYETLALSGNSYVSTMEYNSGEHLYLKITFSNNAFVIVPITLPFYEKSIAEIKPPSQHKIVVKVPYPPATLTLKLLDSSGNTVASGSTVTVTGTTAKFDLLILNTQRDTGLLAPFTDPITKKHYTRAVVVTLNGKAAITDWALAYSSGTVKTYYAELPELAAVYDPATGTVNTASKSYSMSIDISAMAVNDTATISITSYVDADIQYLKDMQTINSNAVALASYSVTLLKQ